MFSIPLCDVARITWRCYQKSAVALRVANSAVAMEAEKQMLNTFLTFATWMLPK
jgi:hypothetical protein